MNTKKIYMMPSMTACTLGAHQAILWASGAIPEPGMLGAPTRSLSPLHAKPGTIKHVGALRGSY